MNGALVFLGLLCSAVAAGAAEVAPLVDAVVGAYGGPAAVKKLEAFRVEADVRSAMQGPGKTRRDFQAPDRLRVEVAYAATKEVRMLDGAKGWRGDDGKVGRVDGPPRLAMVYQMLRSTVPESLVAHRARLQDLGSRAKDGVEYRVLGLPWSQELGLTFWIDPKTHRVVWVEGEIQAGPMKTSFATRYEAFQLVEGVLIPFAEENYASGQHTGTTTVRSVRFSPRDLGPFDPTRL